MRFLKKTILIALLALVGFANPAAGADGKTASPVSDEVFFWKQNTAGNWELYYIWNKPAVIYSLSMAPGQLLLPGREVLVVNPEGRSKGKVKITQSMKVIRLTDGLAAATELGKNPAALTKLQEANTLAGTGELNGTFLAELAATALSHDSVKGGLASNRLAGWGDSFVGLWQSTGLYDIIRQTGVDFPNTWILGLGRVLMMMVALVLIYLAVFK